MTQLTLLRAGGSEVAVLSVGESNIAHRYVVLSSLEPDTNMVQKVKSVRSPRNVNTPSPDWMPCPALLNCCIHCCHLWRTLKDGLYAIRLRSSPASTNTTIFRYPGRISALPECTYAFVSFVRAK